MSGGIGVLLPRLAVLALLMLLVSTAATYAAQGGSAPTTPPAVTVPEAPKELVVPDVRKQAYVFAKGILEESGFAWKVQGAVRGYAANLVASQTPAPGTKLVDTGAPLVTLTLLRNGSYGQDGAPDDASPYTGTKVRLAGTAAPKRAPAARAAKPKKTAAPPQTASPPAAKPAPKKKAVYPQKRPVAFVVAGAPVEPLDEMPLPARVAQLDAWLTKHSKVSAANVDHWLFQHSWIVTGARFGWWRGAEALRLLIRVDERAQKLWGVGSKSELLARRALAEVEARASASSGS